MDTNIDDEYEDTRNEYIGWVKVPGMLTTYTPDLSNNNNAWGTTIEWVATQHNPNGEYYLRWAESKNCIAVPLPFFPNLQLNYFLVEAMLEPTHMFKVEVRLNDPWDGDFDHLYNVEGTDLLSVCLQISKEVYSYLNHQQSPQVSTTQLSGTLYYGKDYPAHSDHTIEGTALTLTSTDCYTSTGLLVEAVCCLIAEGVLPPTTGVMIEGRPITIDSNGIVTDWAGFGGNAWARRILLAVLNKKGVTS